jgi:predicted Zn-dependent peptidase
MTANLLPVLALAAAAAGAGAPAPYTIPVEYVKLDNGLKVVLSVDRTAPTASVAVYYKIGFRIEPKERTGFAHLFEHMMFQGSQNLGKMEFIRLIQSNGGVLNGSTRFDFTNYFEVVPANAVETALWAEADRMRGLAITQENLTNQQGVVKNEVKVNVLNQPYEGFPWIDMPMVANENWYNAHNFYGDLEHLDAATLADVQEFFRRFYTPSNAVVVVAGDIDTKQTLEWVRRHFGPLPKAEAPKLPDISEPRQEKERRATRQYPQAPRPALAVAWHMPPRQTPEYFAMGLIDQILLQGKDSRLHRALVQEAGLTGEVEGGVNWPLGTMHNVNGPTLYMASLFHDADKGVADVLKVLDREIEALRTKPVEAAELERALVKLRSDFYGNVEDFFGFGRADLLASFALFDDDPQRINRIEEEFRKVTPELVQRTAEEWLRSTNRTVLIAEAGAAKPASSAK